MASQAGLGTSADKRLLSCNQCQMLDGFPAKLTPVIEKI